MDVIELGKALLYLFNARISIQYKSHGANFSVVGSGQGLRPVTVIYGASSSIPDCGQAVLSLAKQIQYQLDTGKVDNGSNQEG